VCFTCNSLVHILNPMAVLDALALGTGSSMMEGAHLVCILNPMLVLNALAPEPEAVSWKLHVLHMHLSYVHF
jgi:hypothetical protein